MDKIAVVICALLVISFSSGCSANLTKGEETQTAKSYAFGRAVSGFDVNRDEVTLPEQAHIDLINGNTFIDNADVLKVNGEFSELVVGYPNGNLSVGYVPVMILQQFNVTDLLTDEIAVFDHSGKLARSYAKAELEQFILFENKEIVIIDMRYALTGLGIQQYISLIEEMPAFSSHGNMTPVPPPFLIDGELSFVWLSDIIEDCEVNCKSILYSESK